MPRRLLLFCLMASALTLGVESNEHSRADTTDFDIFCRKEYREKNPNHTACLKPGGGVTFKNYDDNMFFKDTVLSYLNNYRGRVAQGRVADFPNSAAMMLLEWDDELMITAYVQASFLLGDPRWPLHDRVENRFTSRFQVTGQSVCKIWDLIDSNAFMWKKVLKIWFDEAGALPPTVTKAYTFRKNTENFTQMVWATTRFVGCHFSGKPDGPQYYVCNYAPAGNLLGRPIYPTGWPCSRCPNGYACQAGLCATREQPSPWPSFPDDNEDDMPLSSTPGTAVVRHVAAGAIVVARLLQMCCN